MKKGGQFTIWGINRWIRGKIYLVTGAAGFIGYFLCKRGCLMKVVSVVGIDNLNDYYDVKLKEDRLANLNPYSKFTFIKADISEKDAVMEAFGNTGRILW